MPITLYELAGAEADRRFSPFCWRTRIALAHKGLDVETVPWCFTEKDRLPQPNAGRVPAIVAGDRVVHDSTATADYLEQSYPDRPSLFGDEIGRALARFVQNWTETVLLAGLIRLVVLDIHRDFRAGGHGSFGGEGPKDHRGEPRACLEEPKELRKWDRREDAIGERADRIQGVLEETAGKANEVPGERDIQNLAASVI